MMAKSLVRNRHAVTKMYQLKSQLQAVSLRIAVRGVFARGPPVGVAFCWQSGKGSAVKGQAAGMLCLACAA